MPTTYPQPLFEKSTNTGSNPIRNQSASCRVSWRRGRASTNAYACRQPVTRHPSLRAKYRPYLPCLCHRPARAPEEVAWVVRWGICRNGVPPPHHSKLRASPAALPPPLRPCSCERTSDNLSHPPRPSLSPGHPLPRKPRSPCWPTPAAAPAPSTTARTDAGQAVQVIKQVSGHRERTCRRHGNRRAPSALGHPSCT